MKKSRNNTVWVSFSTCPSVSASLCPSVSLCLSVTHSCLPYLFPFTEDPGTCLFFNRQSGHDTESSAVPPSAAVIKLHSPETCGKVLRM